MNGNKMLMPILVIIVAVLVLSQFGIVQFAATPASQLESTTVYQPGNCGVNKESTLYVIGTSTKETIQGATTNPTIAVAGTTSGAFLFTNGENHLIAPLQTAGIGATLTAFTNVIACGDGTEYYIVAGNDLASATKTLDGVTDFYLSTSETFTVDSVQPNVNVALDPIGNVTVSGKREGGAITTFYNETNMYTGILTADLTYNDMYVKISETARGYYRDAHMAVGPTAGDAATIANQFETFAPAGGVEASLPTRLQGTYTTSYRLPMGTIAPTTDHEIRMDMTTSAAYVGGNSNPVLLLYDIGTYLDRGVVIDAAENLANINIGSEDAGILTVNTA